MRRAGFEVRRSPGLVVGALVGIAVGFASAGAFGVLDAGLIGWCAGALAYMIVSALTMSKVDMQAVWAEDSSADEVRAALLWVSLAAAILALLAVLVDLAEAGVSAVENRRCRYCPRWRSSSPGSSSRSPSPSIMRTSFGWTASVSPSRVGKPGFWDLLYVALMIGITYQSSDVADVQRGVRKLLIAHSLISFVFNTVILALVINLAAALAG